MHPQPWILKIRGEENGKRKDGRGGENGEREIGRGGEMARGKLGGEKLKSWKS